MDFCVQGRPVAVKVLTHSYTDGQPSASEQDGQSLLQEVHILSRLHHPHIVNLFGGCIRPPRIFIIEGGSRRASRAFTAAGLIYSHMLVAW